MSLLHPRMLTRDEELGKRDDDFRPKRKESMSQQFNPLRWRKRRFFAILSVLFVIYVLVQNIPTIAPIKDRVTPPSTPPSPPQTTTIAPVSTVSSTTEPTGAPPHEKTELDKQYYNGIIRFYRLAASLNRVAAMSKPPEVNNNVLFAASSMKSLANLLPLACEMARIDRNWVHVAVMSRTDLSLDEIRTINNIDDEKCPVMFHDARADYHEYSNDARHDAAVSGGLHHLKTHMSPHALIVDDESVEDPVFSTAIRRKAKEQFLTLIEIPRGAYESFQFITKLDHASLASWYTPTIEIVVQAQKESVGSFIRLLRGLAAADYKGMRLPKLTINLATSIQPALRSFLQTYRWPPRYEPATRDVDPVTIRHQVQSHSSTEQAAMRLIESFYPASPDHHVLLLSPQVELSPQYLQYLHYAILEYKYAKNKSKGLGELLGISLNVPASQLNGDPFVAPVDKLDSQDERTSFLYSVPTSSSLLVFGDKWSVFHSFITNRIIAMHAGKAARKDKVLPETEPGWMEFLLELMQARGWSVLYPGDSLATVHNELFQIPEEFTKDPKPPGISASSLEEPFLLATTQSVPQEHVEEELPTPQIPLHQSMPDGGQLLHLHELPYLLHNGDAIKMDDAQHAKTEYLHAFRREIGGCDDEEAVRPRIIKDDTADDLFCLPTVDMLFDTEAEGIA